MNLEGFYNTTIKKQADKKAEKEGKKVIRHEGRYYVISDSEDEKKKEKEEKPINPEIILSLENKFKEVCQILWKRELSKILDLCESYNKEVGFIARGYLWEDPIYINHREKIDSWQIKYFGKLYHELNTKDREFLEYVEGFIFDSRAIGREEVCRVMKQSYINELLLNFTDICKSKLSSYDNLSYLNLIEGESDFEISGVFDDKEIFWISILKLKNVQRSIYEYKFFFSYI